MSAQQPTPLAVGSTDDRKWFRGITDDVDPNEDDALTEQRLEQWRPLWQNPFAQPDLLAPLPENNHTQPLVAHAGGDDEKGLEKPEMSRANTGLSQQNSVVVKTIKVAHVGPTWVNLFYDLAWTASFASLTQNGQLDEPWDTVSYVAFFLVVWWLWASQTLYSVHFNTNDWIHLISIFLQLIIFGLLAATTRGYDVTAYIMRSPGINTLEPQTLEEMVDPERYRADRVASHSLDIIAISLAASRTLLWLQHIIVLIFAIYTARKQKLRIPLKLYVLPIGLIISNGLFWAATGITISARGKTVLGAKLKFVLWGVGLIVEVALHGLMESVSWEKTNFRRGETSDNLRDSLVSNDLPAQPELLNAPTQPSKPIVAQKIHCWPVPHSNVNLRERLEGITTVILGEGLNGIAGTLYSVISAPGLGGPVPANIACAAFVVYFLAYLYFEGPTGHRDPKGGPVRRMIWMLLHFPFHLGIILLLLGVKNQFILTSYLSTALKTFKVLDEVMGGQELYLNNATSAFNLPMKNFLLKRGVTWATEFQELNATVTNNGTISLDDVSEVEFEERVGVWSMRLSLKIMVQFYKTFMGENSEIDSEIQNKINDYYTNFTPPLEDWTGSPDLASSYTYESIITDLLKSNLLGARYIVGLAAAILISLGAMNRLHSKPRDRFQWGIILSRFSMGAALTCLILLNVGDIQSLWVFEDQVSRQAGVFRWIWAWMVLPTLAIAFAVEFIIEWVLLRCAGLAIARKRGRVTGSFRQSFLRKPFGVAK